MTEHHQGIVDAAFRNSYDARIRLRTVSACELGHRGLRTMPQQPIPAIDDNVRTETGFRADLVTEDKVIVEITSVELLAPVHKKPLLTYLRLAEKRLDFLVHFHLASSKTASRALSIDSKTKFTPSRQDYLVALSMGFQRRSPWLR